MKCKAICATNQRRCKREAILGDFCIVHYDIKRKIEDEKKIYKRTK